MSDQYTLVLDYETAWSSASANKYSLFDIPTLAYIKDERFHAWGCGFCIIKPDGEVTEPKWVTHKLIPKFFEQYDKRYGWDNTTFVAHNAAFDSMITSIVYDYKPARVRCTQGLANALMDEWDNIQNNVPGWGAYRIQKSLPKGIKPGVNLNYLCHMLGLPAGHKNDSLSLTNGVIPAEGNYIDDNVEALLADDCTTDVGSITKLYQMLIERCPDDTIKINEWCMRQAYDPVLCLDETFLDSEAFAVEAHQIHWHDRVWELINRVNSEEHVGHFEIPAPKKPSRKPKPAYGSIDHTLQILRGRQAFPALLFAAGLEHGDIPTSYSKTNPDFLALKEHDNPDIKMLVDARLKLSSGDAVSRVKKYLSVAQATKKSLWPVGLMPSGARNTHRFGGTDIGGGNPQNLNKKSLMRKSIVAPDDHMLVVADLSGIELRLTLEFCGQRNEADKLYAGEDLYVDFAVNDLFPDLYPKDGTVWTKYNVDEMHRFIGKTGVLQSGYQAGGAKMYQSMVSQATALFGEYTEPVDLEGATACIKAYRKRMRDVKQMWSTLQQALDILANTKRRREIGPVTFENMGITLPNGLRIKYCDLQGKYGREYSYIDPFKGGPECWSAKDQTFKRINIYGGKVLENICQALTAQIMNPIILRLEKYYRVALQVHDELAIVVPKQEVLNAKEIIHEEFTRPVPWMPNLVLDCEEDFSYRYGDAK
jgi:hypothetical protein